MHNRDEKHRREDAGLDDHMDEKKTRTDEAKDEKRDGSLFRVQPEVKQKAAVMLIGAALLAAALNISEIGQMIGYVLGLVMPIVIGAGIAFVMNVPMRGYEKLFRKLSLRIEKKRGKGISEGKILLISMWLTLISLILVIVLVITRVVPEIINSLISLYKVIEDAIPGIVDYLQKNIDPKWIDVEWISQKLTDLLNETNISRVILKLSNGAYDVIGMVFTFATTTIGTIMSVAISMIVALYMLLSKKKLANQTQKVLYAFLKEPVADKICHIGQLINDTYAKFLSGQCVEAFIIAILLFIAFTIFRLPYASLVGVLAGVLSFIPYIGSWTACAIGALLILIIDPWKAILSIVVYQVVQFLEGQLIYPRVVGNSVGLPPLYTLLAAILGGKLFGIVGIIFFIPFVAVVYTLVKEATGKRLRDKKIDL